MKTIALLFSLMILLLGLASVLAPSVLTTIGEASLSAGAFLLVAAFRLAFGLILLRVAPASRMPRTVRVIGGLVLLSGLATLGTWFFALDHARAVIEQWLARGDLTLRLTGAVLVVFGGLLSYGLASGSTRR
jgi:hypothetical protein